MTPPLTCPILLCHGETCIFSQYLANAYQTCHCNLFFFVLWTHCLAKSLWGSLNRLCFPSGESIQVTDTEGWPQSKWPLTSWKCLLIWRLTISDVTADYKIKFSPAALSSWHICFLHLSPDGEIKSRGRHEDCFRIEWPYINKSTDQLCPCLSRRRCAFLFVLCPLGVIQVFWSVVWSDSLMLWIHHVFPCQVICPMCFQQVVDI